MIRKSGGKWCLYSRTKGKKDKRKNLGCYSSLEGAQKREKDVKKFKHMKEEGLMNIKKSKIIEMIKEELEVILTNDEAHEIFDLDAGALLDAMMKEVVTVSTKDIVESTQFPTSSDGPRGAGSGRNEPSIRVSPGQEVPQESESARKEAAGRLTRRVGTHAADKAAASNVATWAQREKQEILDRLSGIKADGDYSPEEKEGLLVAQALEGIVNDALDIVFRDEDSWKKNRAPVLAAAEGFRRKLAALAKNVVSQPAAPAETAAEKG
jgi:hypothetical protein